MDQPPLDNRTRFRAHPQLIVTRSGEQLVLIGKASFELDPAEHELVLAPKERQRPIRMADVPWNKEQPEKSSVKYPNDLFANKPGTDVVVVARAHASENKPVPWFDAFVSVGPLRRAIRVFGLRVWQGGGAGLSEPRPTTSADVSYENAWGGEDVSDAGKVVAEPRNPVGLGVAADSARLTHQLAPSIEDPDQLLCSARTRPPPAGLGPIARHWEPRRRYAGTYDEVWKRTRAPLTPLDEDDRIHACASAGLYSPEPLLGSEPVGLLNLVPGGGAARFSLPCVGLEVEFRVKGREPQRIRPHLDMVLIDTLIMQAGLPLAVELTWRASTRAPRRVTDSLTVVREIGVPS